jgi:hypothetical protein
MISRTDTNGDIHMVIEDDGSDDEKKETKSETKQTKRTKTEKKTINYGTPRQIAEYENAEETVDKLTQWMWGVGITDILAIVMTVWTLGSITDHLSITLLVLTVIVAIYKTIEMAVFYTKRAIFNRPLPVVDKEGYMIPTPDGEIDPEDDDYEEPETKKKESSQTNNSNINGRKFAHFKTYSKMSNRIDNIIVICAISVISIVIWFFILLIQIMFELRENKAIGPTGVFAVWNDFDLFSERIFSRFCLFGRKNGTCAERLLRETIESMCAKVNFTNINFLFNP